MTKLIAGLLSWIFDSLPSSTKHIVLEKAAKWGESEYQKLEEQDILDGSYIADNEITCIHCIHGSICHLQQKLLSNVIGSSKGDLIIGRNDENRQYGDGKSTTTQLYTALASCCRIYRNRTKEAT